MNDANIRKALEDLTEGIIQGKNKLFVDCLLSMFHRGILEARECYPSVSVDKSQLFYQSSFGIVFRGYEKMEELELKVKEQAAKIEELENIIGNMGQDLTYAHSQTGVTP